MQANASYDAIVVGSGIGGLAAASLLAGVAGKRVLVLERHFKAGGFTHTFKRRRWSFDVGLHYVGEMGPGQQVRRLFDLASGAAVEWRKMASPFERFLYPGFSFEVPDDETAYRAALAEAFPAERAAIDRWFHELRRATAWTNRHFVGLLLPRPAAALLDYPGRASALRTTAEALAQTFRDPRLRALLASQWGDYGLPPSRSAFAVHAMIARHYLGGAYYPEGGAGAIAPAFLAQIEAAGGACRVNHEVSEVLVEGGRAAGVRALAHEGGAAREVTFRAPLVISDAGVATTSRLLGRPGPAAGPAREPRLSSVALYLGLRSTPAALGFRGENRWMFEAADHEAVFARRNEVLRGKAVMAYLSFPTLKGGTVSAASGHTAEVVAMVDAEPFARWRDRPWLRRGDDYQALKATIAGALLDLVERHHPGFRELIAYQEVSTPLTIEHFTGHAGGSIYGAPATPERFRDRSFGVRTPIPGLLMAGADAVSLGIVGAFMGGALAAGAAMGRFGIRKIFEAAARQPASRVPERDRAAA